ncbi:MAG: DnaD domain protein [Ruminococcaceae bacterium]|nr:DnaD domain protein [Oscillospiraceae bacterium]
MKLSVEYGNGVISLPERALDVIGGASELELKLLLLICSDSTLREDFSISEAAQLLSVSEHEIEIALAFLSGAGLIITDSADRKSVSVRVKKAGDRSVTVVKSGKDAPSYTGAEIEEIFRQNDKLGGLIDSCQRILGKIFTLIEINKIIALCDLYRLDGEYIETVFAYAAKIGKPSVPYADKLARELYEQGIITLDALNKRLDELDKISSLESFVRRLFGLGERKLTSKESKFVEQWVSFDYSEEMIELAYEITVDNGKGASMPYMNKVLTNWRDAGHKTTDEVIASIEKYRQSKKDAPISAQSDIEKAILMSSRIRAKKQLEDKKNG